MWDTSLKPHKGSLKDWWKHYPLEEFGSEGLGYIICGVFVDHEDFAGEDSHTSWVVSHDETEGYVETLNSRYILIGEPIKPPVCAGR